MGLWDSLADAWEPLILVLILIIAAYAIGIIMSSLNLTGSVLGYAMQTKINYGWVNAKYIYIFFELLIGGVAVYGIVRLLASLRAEK